MEGHKVTIHVSAKPDHFAGYTDTFYVAETDVQRVKYLYHKYTHENHPDVVSAEGSHTLHINGDYPQVQRLRSIEPLAELPEDDTLPLRFI